METQKGDQHNYQHARFTVTTARCLSRNTDIPVYNSEATPLAHGLDRGNRGELLWMLIANRQS